MKPHVLTPSDKHESLTLSLSNLRHLYLGTVEELRECADHMPSDLNDDPDMDAREGVLLDFEGHLLDQAARTPVKSKEDMIALMDIWLNASGAIDQAQRSPADRLVLNIFRCIEATWLAA
ncbi:hypothetical protein GCM10011309_02270 [Litorimonas cladophorae]|uniref:Uncharacterized protein n=1 Tax=Litorimonas cladophorae TaxID=1220491 RepID=A0A918NC52_9PROT|nr:hypothetical protein [Litorimonas cladophorae]GGX56941.1 hypothetical protein GCM10011309_02270 [Litorimonas cladophorae]